MSTLAIWLFVAVAVLLVSAVAIVILAFLSTLRKGKVLVHEMDALSQDMARAVGSQQQHELDG